MLKIVILSAAFLLSEISGACSCIPQSHKEAFAQAQFVFRGRVVEVTKRSGQYSVKLQISRVWKGKNLGVMQEVTTALSPAACGFQFKPDREYVVFTRKGKTPHTDSCTNTDSVDSPRGGAAITWLDINQPPKNAK